MTDKKRQAASATGELVLLYVPAFKDNLCEVLIRPHQGIGVLFMASITVANSPFCGRIVVCLACRDASFVGRALLGVDPKTPPVPQIAEGSESFPCPLQWSTRQEHPTH